MGRSLQKLDGSASHQAVVAWSCVIWSLRATWYFSISSLPERGGHPALGTVERTKSIGLAHDYLGTELLDKDCC